MVDRARKEFQGVEGANILEVEGLFLISIQNRLVVRFKKLDDEMKSRNVQTRRQRDYLKQLDLPGIPRATRLEAGYRLNLLQTGIDSVVITCPIGSKVGWYLELQPSAPTNVVELPFKSQIPGVTSRFTIKKEERKERRENGEPGN